ncbi:hypothetical protein UA08_02574 [Talaromyces atroroseus]|uniref:Uncharacterized protein n=1 Tax=Talaromyces atroroseus TaxID=1441469 RepID=A0A225B6F4_TALAT|nr:hypothetical protein UA08_02574 [Talaromyces atroroseus]OKL62445.1 hypothetical protein UA08_02574 [Talaromyces atroroseus]
MTAAAAAPPAPAPQTTRMKLEVETRQLQRSWREFHESLRYQDHHQQQRPPQPDDLVREIAEEIQYWSSHRQRVLFRKAIKWAQKCLDTMDAHAVLMQTLPDSKYCDLFFGVVYSIVKAVKEQYRVAEAFLKFLARINHAVASAVSMECSTELAAALYGQIFLFLGEFLRDYVAKARCRLLYSHNEDFKSNFKNLVASVENLALMRLESACVDSSCANNHTLVDHAHHFEKIGLEGAARKHASQTTTLLQLIWNMQQQKILNQKLAVDQARILDEFLASLQAQVHQTNDGECHLSGTSVIHPQIREPTSSEITPKRRLVKSILQHDSSPLQDFFDNNEQIYPFGPDQPLEISAPIATALFDWAQTNPSPPLAIAGSAGLPSRLTLVSACYIFVARKHNIPVISHFCASSPRASKKDGLIALIYSLIRQLIELAPPMLNCDSNCDLSGERFRRLDGTIGSLADALSILDTLLHYKPPVLFCVIDSLDVLVVDYNNNNNNNTNNNNNHISDQEDQTEQYVKSLVSMLASHTQITTTITTATQQSSTSSSSGLIKVLFTTTGPCNAIQCTLVGQGLGQAITTDPMHTQSITDDDTIMTEG